MLNTAPPTGFALYQLPGFTIYFFERNTDGFVRMMSNTVLDWRVSDHNSALLDAGSGTTTTNGWVLFAPAIPAGYSGRLEVVGSALTPNGQLIENTTYRSFISSGESGVFGVVRSDNEGTVEIDALEHPKLGVTVPVAKWGVQRSLPGVCAWTIRRPLLRRRRVEAGALLHQGREGGTFSNSEHARAPRQVGVSRLLRRGGGGQGRDELEWPVGDHPLRMCGGPDSTRPPWHVPRPAAPIARGRRPSDRKGPGRRTRLRAIAGATTGASRARTMSEWTGSGQQGGPACRRSRHIRTRSLELGASPGRLPDERLTPGRSCVLVAAAVLGTVAALCAQDARSFWSELPVDGEVIVTTRWPLPERCQAAATKTTLYVADPSGSLLWRWPFRDTNRFIHVTHNSTVALSPDCQHAILAGTRTTRDVWAVARDGRARVVRTIGTPLFAAFSLDGTTVGVVTGARRGYLFAPMLTVKWSGNTSHIPIRWPSQVGGVGGEGGGATFARAEVEQLLGALMWGWGVNDDVSDDGQWRAVIQQEPRGPGPGSVEFFGPHADGFHGRLLPKRPRWRQAVGCPSAELSADAEFVIVTGDFKNPNNQCATDTFATMVFDREGTVVASLQIPHATGTGYSPQERDELVAAVALAARKPLRLKER